jgi:hypothetical protein
MKLTAKHQELMRTVCHLMQSWNEVYGKLLVGNEDVARDMEKVREDASCLQEQLGSLEEQVEELEVQAR